METNTEFSAMEGPAEFQSLVEQLACRVRQPVELTRACCFVLMISAREAGADRSSLPLELAQARQIINNAPSPAPPETLACRFWLSLLDGSFDARTLDDCVAILETPVWAPFRWLAVRTLGYFGRRSRLVSHAPRTLSDADAWLESTLGTSTSWSWLKHIETLTDDSLPREISLKWISLLKIEAALAFDTPAEGAETVCAHLMEPGGNSTRATYSGAMARYIAGRAAVALMRFRLARGVANPSILGNKAGDSLPLWEREYWQALAFWQLNVRETAIAGLRRSVEHNPYQSPPRLALATLLAEKSQEDALAVLNGTEPTRELRIVRGALLARLGRYDEADQMIAEAGRPNTLTEPVRFTCPGEIRRYRRQEQVLRAALAEHDRHWTEALKAWQAVGFDGSQRALQETRTLFMTHLQARNADTQENWKQRAARNRLGKGSQEYGSMPLMSTAQFFRALAIMDTNPERAIRDFCAILKREVWCDAEKRAGGGRLLCVGDALLHLGCLKEAAEAYEALQDCLPELAIERLGVVSMRRLIAKKVTTDEILAAADRADERAPSSPWPQLLAAQGLLMDGQIEAASARIQLAQHRGAPTSLMASFRLVTELLSGVRQRQDEELANAQLPPEINAMLRLIYGSGSLSERVRAYADALGDQWLELCPIDLQRAARCLVDSLWQEGNRESAREFAERLVVLGYDWASDLILLLRVRDALEAALRNGLEQAAADLRECLG